MLLFKGYSDKRNSWTPSVAQQSIMLPAEIRLSSQLALAFQLGNSSGYFRKQYVSAESPAEKLPAQAYVSEG